MSLHNRITEDMKNAMRSKDKDRLSVIRMLMSEIKYAQAATNVHEPLDDQAVQNLLAKYHKKLTKSLNDYPEGDQRTAIESELSIVAEYLPKALSKEEVAKIVDDVIAGSSDSNFGVLMKAVMAKTGSAADGKIISSLLKEKIKS